MNIVDWIQPSFFMNEKNFKLSWNWSADSQWISKLFLGFEFWVHIYFELFEWKTIISDNDKRLILKSLLPDQLNINIPFFFNPPNQPSAYIYTHLDLPVIIIFQDSLLFCGLRRFTLQLIIRLQYFFLLLFFFLF